MNSVSNKLCEVCSSPLPSPQLKLGDHPLCDDLLPVGSNLTCETYPIDVSLCNICLTANQIHKVNKQLLFPSSYHYRARFTQDVLMGMKDLSESITEVISPLQQDGYVLDVGCNDGSLLNFFHDLGYKTVGVEPTDAADDADVNKHKIYKNYFDIDLARKLKEHLGSPKVITFTNVFAHIDNFKELLTALSLLIDENTIIVIENHYLGSVVSGGQFDTFYHEHPRTYSAKSFDFIAKLLGRSVISRSFPKRYGGNIRIWIARDELKTLQLVKEDISEEHLFAEFSKLPLIIEDWITLKSQQINDLVNRWGPIPAKAFPARSAILVKLLGLDEQKISAVYERTGSMKIGHYVPGTRIPILDEAELFASPNTKPVLNLAWHISDEIHTYLKKHAHHMTIVDIK